MMLLAFPNGCQNHGGRWEQGSSAGVQTSMKSIFGSREAWAYLSKLNPYILMSFWLDIQSTAEVHKWKRLWRIYTVCWYRLLKKNILDYLRFILEVWSPHIIGKSSGIHSALHKGLFIHCQGNWFFVVWGFVLVFLLMFWQLNNSL